MIEGVLLKGYGGFYYVYAEDRVWECSLRGRFRVKDQDFLPGDRVRILPEGGERATIEGVEPRRNFLIRPSISNVDQALLVFALTSPKPDLNLLDRLLIQVTNKEIEPIIVFTKADKVLEGIAENFDGYEIPESYQKIGYTVFIVSSETGQGIPELRTKLQTKITVLAGPSGAGKSSLCNALSPGITLKTGEISLKSKRGRHTTRHVELMICGGGLVADTPGFSSLRLPLMKRTELTEYFPEFVEYHGHCRFNSCLHDQEPDCAIKSALAKGEITAVRYEHYRIFLQEIIAAERRY